MSIFTLRTGQPADIDELSRIAIVAKKSWGYDEATIKIWQNELIVNEDMIRTYITYVAIVNSQEIAGFWCREAKPGESDGRLFILPQYQRQGCGRLLWNAVMTEAYTRGIRHFIFETDKHALPFYLKMGAILLQHRPSKVIPGIELALVQVNL